MKITNNHSENEWLFRLTFGIFYVIIRRKKDAQLEKYTSDGEKEMNKTLRVLIVIFIFLITLFCFLFNFEISTRTTPLAHNLWWFESGQTLMYDGSNRHYIALSMGNNLTCIFEINEDWNLWTIDYYTVITGRNSVVIFEGKNTPPGTTDGLR